MPRGRFLSKAISLDEKVNALSDDTARLLFTWLISHLDCEGRLHGDPTTVKSIVFPRRKISVRRVEKYLEEIAKLELILRYSINGNAYLLAPHFEKHQVGLQKSKEAQSQIPPPPPELLQSYAGESPPQVEAKAKVKAKVVVDNNLLKELENLLKWGKTHLEEDASWLLEFLEEYPELTQSHIKACRDYHSNKTRHNKALWKTRLRNWMRKEGEIQKGDQGGAYRGHSKQASTEELKGSIGRPLD